MRATDSDSSVENHSFQTQTHLAHWNLTWESADLWGNWRLADPDFDLDDLPPTLSRSIRDHSQNVDLRLLPRLMNDDATVAAVFDPLLRLLPKTTLDQFGLPLGSGRGPWPPVPWGRKKTVSGFRTKLSQAFSHHIWPLLCKQSPISAFSPHDSIVVLSSDLNFWFAHLDRLIRDYCIARDSVSFDEEYTEESLAELQRSLPDGMFARRPRFGGDVWRGEEDAWAVTKDLVEEAMNEADLRSVIDALRSHRVADDFSNRWSRSKEDFERKLYSKRSKCRVSFIEFEDTVPVAGPDAEFEANRLWQDLFAIADPKERHVVVCLREGTTRVGDIAKELGYSNHSPVSKKLASIRAKAKRLLDIN